MDGRNLCSVVLAAFASASPVWNLSAQQSATNYPTRSTTENLAEKRYVAAGDRAYVVGTQDGKFPGMGFHIKGHMNGVWAHPLKLLDSYQFLFDGSALPAVQKFTSAPGFVRLTYPDSSGLQVTRTEFSPDRLPVVLIGLEIRNTGNQPKNTNFSFQPISEILPAYPWSGTMPTSDELDQRDNVRFDPLISGLIFSEPGKPWTALVAGKTASLGPQDSVQFLGADLSVNTPDLGKKASGLLNWQLMIAPGSTVNIWLAVAGSHITVYESYVALLAGLQSAESLLAGKLEERLDVLAQSKAVIPDPAIQAAFDWAKLNLADFKRIVLAAKIRDINEGKVYPAPLASFPFLSGFGAGYPDYPWYFGTDGSYTAYPLVASGQWDVAKAHLNTIRKVSRAVNGDTGKVLHEIVTDGSVYFGTNSQPGDTQETPQFATAVATVWRWTGDNAFRDVNYQFIVDGLRYITSTLDSNNDGWPEGAGIVEDPSLGAEKLDVAVYTIRALNDLVQMARSKGDQPNFDWAEDKAEGLRQKFDHDWWNPSFNLFSDSLCFSQVLATDPKAAICPPSEIPPGRTSMQLQQLFWINATPMETSIARPERAAAAFPQLESSVFTGTTGYWQQGQDLTRGIKGNRQASAVNTSVMAVAEANYGRLSESLRYVNFVASELDTEQPGALPELFDSPDYKYFQDFTSRAMVMQAWASYGVEWPVIYEYLGVRPDIPAGEITIVPQLPSTWPELSARDIRVGPSTLNARASQSDDEYRTEVETPPGYRLVLGYVLPADSPIKTVRLNGQVVAFQIEDNHRGREVKVTINSGQRARLVVRTR
jgi:hypothetical protein